MDYGFAVHGAVPAEDQSQMVVLRCERSPMEERLGSMGIEDRPGA